MEPKDWIALVGIISTASVAIATLLINSKRERLQRERDDRVRHEQQVREDLIREKESVHQPRISFSINCTFFGPQAGHYALEVSLIIDNIGRIRHQMKSIILRLRGIDTDTELTFWRGTSRLEFPNAILKDEELVPKGYEFFVEPGVKQTITFLSKVPSSCRFLLAYSRFDYGSTSDHSVERLFMLP